METNDTKNGTGDRFANVGETLKKINEGVALYKTGNNKSMMRGLHILDSILMDHKLLDTLRIKALTTMMSLSPIDANDRIVRLSDVVKFYPEDDREPEINVLMRVISNPKVDSQEKLACAVSLHNLGNISECYKMFEHIAEDLSVGITYRVEACSYLIYSTVYEYVELGQELIKLFTSSEEYPSDYRYKIIARFITSTGFATMLNGARLDIEYDEVFVTDLEKEFFYDVKKNGVRERIMSGQHLLSTSTENMSDDEKAQVQEVLMSIASGEENEEYDENIRADAADVVLRLGSQDGQEDARKIIEKLGNSSPSKLFGIKTVYTNSQNVHNRTITDSALEFLENSVNKILEKRSDGLFKTVNSEVTASVYTLCIKPKERAKAFKSLNRIFIDTATYTKRRIPEIDVFCFIWRSVCEDSETDELKKRFIEELVDMADTCSSGHVLRLVNVLSGHGITLKISWEDQIRANVSARLNKRLETVTDPSMLEKIVLGMSGDAEDDEREAYLNYVESQKKSLKDELHTEFVEGGHLSDDEFSRYFNQVINEIQKSK